MALGTFLCPPKFKFVRKRLPPCPAILDVGCGNHSPTLTKRWFPGARYAGADIQDYNIDDADRAAMDHFYPITAAGGGYDAIPDDSFDLVLMNHVVEHMRDPMPVVAQMCRKLRSGGCIWIAFPSLRSLALPSATGTLHFCDDDTHVRVVDVKDVSNVLLDNGVRIVHAGRTRDWIRGTLGLAVLPVAYARNVLTGRLPAYGLWYTLGFEDHVFGCRR